MSAFRHLVIVLAAALLLSSPLLRGEVPPPEKLQKQLAGATAEKYPDADTVTIYDCERVVYQPDGLYVSVNDFCIKAVTEAGRKSLRRLSFNFDSDYGAYTVPSAAIVKPDGRRIAVDLEKNLSVAISTRSMGSNIYSRSDKVLTLVLPDLEIGDAVVMTLKYTGVKTPFPGIFSDGFSLQGSDPLLFAEVIVDAPEALPLRAVAVKSPVAGKVKFLGEKRAGGRIVYRWTAEDVPQLFPEPDMPPFRNVAQRLLVSTAKDWKEISRWYHALCRPRLDAVDDALKAQVAKLVSGKRTDEEKALALFEFVSQKIRYTGVDGEDRAPGFEPHDVRDTFRQRHGVCRDKAGLLVAMLELAGLKAYPTLFRAGKGTVDDEVPASSFNHAIVAWEKTPGKYQLMDPTCETTKEVFPAYYANQSYLVARPEGDVLRRSPSPDPENNLLSISTVAAFDPRGALTAESTFAFNGYDDVAYRSTLARRGREFVRQLFAQRLQRAVPGAEITRFEVSPKNVRDMSAPLKIVVAYRVAGALPATGAATPLPLPELARQFGIAAYTGRESISLQTRRFPLRFDTTAAVREKFQVKLPESVRLLSLPAKTRREAPGADWSREFAAKGGAVTGSSSFRITRLEVAPEQYERLRELRREIASDMVILPLVQTQYSAIPPEKLAEIFPDADTFTESDLTEIEVKPNGAYRIVRRRWRRILTYAGLKNHSELKFNYTPAYQNVEVDAVVITPDGKRHPVAPKHIIDMDAAWVASAPRYPKARTKVVVLPSVQIGAVIETKVVFSSDSLGFFEFILPLRGSSPTARRDVKISAGGDGKLRWSAPPAEADFRIVREGGTRTCSWHMTDLPGLPDEFRQPPARMFVPTVAVSNGKYEEYAKTLDKTFRTLAATPSPAADRLFSEIARKESGKLDRVLAIRDAVAQKLRAAGPDFDDIRLSDLTPPERTLADGYGNSADRALVLAALLDRAGIRYGFVAASDLPYLQENTKMLRDHPRRVFDEVLVYVPEFDLYLNDTDQYAVPGSTAHASKIGLDLGSGRLTAIRPGHKKEDETVTTFDIVLRADGSANIDVTKLYSGNIFNREKRRYLEMTPEERRLHREMVASELLPMGRLEKSDGDFSKYPGRMTFSFKVDKFAVATGGKLLFELPGFADMARSVGAVERDRRTPALRSDAIHTLLKYRIELPKGFRMEQRRAPRVELGRRSSGYFTEHSNVMRNRLAIDAKLVLPVELIQPHDYVELVNLQRDLNRHFTRRIVLSDELVGR